jgi:glycine C-acetyltransferase
VSTSFYHHLNEELETLKSEGLYKKERLLDSPQAAMITVQGNAVINFCANNYLGLANHEALIQACHEGLEAYGYGMASVRFICGTQTPHQQLEARLSAFLNQEETILYSSCFDANGGLFETLMGEEDAIISDALNHASMIDGIRLSKAKRYRYDHDNMAALEAALIEAQSARFRMIATDGVFSMDGAIANLPAICALAKQYNALVMVDDSHAIGVLGPTGRGTAEHYGLSNQVDIITGTLGKALGGASGGFTASSALIIDWLRQRSRPYLFSNALAPMISHTSLKALDWLEANPAELARLRENTAFFRAGLQALGFKLLGHDHPIIPVLLGDARLASEMSAQLLKEGIYVIGFSYPVVPKNQARIRTQISSAHEKWQLQQALDAFERVGRTLGVVN